MLRRAAEWANGGRLGLGVSREALGSWGFLAPAVVVLTVFFVLPLYYVMRFSVGMEHSAPTDALAIAAGQLNGFTMELWRDFLGGTVSLNVAGSSVTRSSIASMIVAIGIIALVVFLVARRLKNGPGWLIGSSLVALLAPFLTIPAGTHLLRIAEWKSEDAFLALFFRSMTMATTSTVWIVLVAVPVAWFIATCRPRKRYLLLGIMVAPFLTSYLLRVFAWKILLGEQGVINTSLSEIGLRGADEPLGFLLYSQFTVILVLIYAWAPFVCLPIFVALERLDGSVIEASRDLGANGIQVCWRVILPLARPGIMAGFLLVFVPSIGEYITPSLVGGTDGFMFGQGVAEFFVGQGENWQLGSVLATFLLLVVIVPGLFAARTLREQSGGSEGQRSRGATLMSITPRGIRVLLGLVFVAFLVFQYAPTTLLAIFSFNDSPLTHFPLQGFTLHWYIDAWTQPAIIDSFFASVRVAAGSALASTSIGLLLAYGLARRNARFKTTVSTLAILPLIVPQVVFGVALLILFQRGPVPIPLGLWAVGIGHTILVLPFSILLLLPRVASIGREIDEAAVDLGATWLGMVRRVLIPLMLPALIASFLMGFVISMDEVVVASFLVQDQPTYPVYLYSMLRFPQRTMLLVAVGTTVIFASLVLLAAVQLIQRIGDRRPGRGSVPATSSKARG